jgi:FK506-binding nuclear protein
MQDFILKMFYRRFEEIPAVDTAVSKKRGADALDASMDVDGGDNLSKAQKKKLAKKLKGTDGSAVTIVQTETTTVTPVATEPKKDKKTKGKEDSSKTDKEVKSAGGEKELAGGLKIRDSTTGTGKVPFDTIFVYLLF